MNYLLADGGDSIHINFDLSSMWPLLLMILVGTVVALAFGI